MLRRMKVMQGLLWSLTIGVLLARIVRELHSTLVP